MNQKRKGTYCLFSLLGSLTLLGCGEAPDVVENVGEVEQAVLGNSNWTATPTVPFPLQAIAPVVAAKRTNDFNSFTWMVGRDSDQQNTLQISKKLHNGSFGAWVLLNGTGSAGATNVLSNPAMVSWQGLTDNTTNRNVAIAYIRTSGSLRVGISNSADATNLNFFTVPGTTGNGFPRPALAHLGNRLFVFTVTPAGAVRYKFITATVSGPLDPSVFSNWSSWTTVTGQTVSGGVAAAATASDTITIMAVAAGCGGSCKARMHKITASTGALNGTWSDVPGGTVFNEGSTPSMTANLTSGARVVARRSDGKMWTATSSLFNVWTDLNQTGCSGPGEPAWAPVRNGGLMMFVTTCGTVTPYFSTL